MRPQARIPDWAWGGAAFVIAAVSIWTMLPQGWVPFDEGSLVLSARYVNAGYLPLRDFTYPYTGGLAYLDAIAMRVAGDTMMAARYPLFAAFLLWLVGVWVLARKHCPPPLAAAVVLLTAWWSVLIYPAAMPTWYLLFLATGVLLAIARWAERGGARWLVLAGFMCGVAIVLKQTGLFTLVGAGFGVLAAQQDKGRGGEAKRTPNAIVLALLALALVVPVALGLRRGLLSGEMLTLALPLATVIAVLAVREVRFGSGDPRALFASWGALTAGALVAPALFVGFYAWNDALHALAEGLGPASLSTASAIERPMPTAPTILAYGLPLALVVAVMAWWKPGRMQTATSVAAAIGVFLLATQAIPPYRAVWYFTVLLVPAAVALMVRRGTSRGDTRAASGSLVAVAAMLVLHALNQFPYAAQNYVGYVAPLSILLAAAIASDFGFARGVTFPAVLLLIYGGWFHRIGSVSTVGGGAVWWDTKHPLSGPHGGLLVTTSDSAHYARLTELVAAHGGADSVAAGPELPALYALAGTRRLVPQPYLLVVDRHADSLVFRAMLDTTAIRSVAINHAPMFLPRVRESSIAWVQRRYPNVERVGDVEFRWR